MRQVVAQILDVFDADAEPHQAVVDSARGAHLGRDARVGHRGRMADQGLDAAQALGQAEELVFRSRSSRAASPPPLSRMLIMPPKSRICRRATSWLGWSGQAGVVDALDLRAARQPVGQARALAQCRSMRTARVLMPRSTSHASNGPGTPPGGVLIEGDRLEQVAGGRSRPHR